MKRALIALVCSVAASGALAENAKTLAYRDAVYLAPNNWKGPIFELSHDYPKQKPAACSTKDCPWLAINLPMKADFSDAGVPSWKNNSVYNQYIKAILDYVKKGQTFDLNNQEGFKTSVNGETQWFHIPWMAYDTRTGREYVHGLTNERTAVISDFYGEKRQGLHALPNSKTGDQPGFETWAVGMYNKIGGYTIGQSWSKKGTPNIETVNGITSTKGMPFIEGTVVVKFLFTTATPDDVPYLKASPVWQADRHREVNNQFLCKREVQEVRLVQVDVAVVDQRSPSRWVYGTFAYVDGAGKTLWDNLQPVGLQWGADPWTFPAVPKAESITARQSVLNRSISTFEHFGCNGRLAGPVDNRQSSCLSCHSGAFANQAGYTFAKGAYSPPVFGFEGLCEKYSQDNVEYFQTIQFPQNYTGGNYANTMNLDTSLQMQIALQEWALFKANGKAVACEDK
ncbi:hypothetical protein [Nitrosovibrio sp. Nv6]|uniref:hypothetical protein n=1 Tax=Nitrosovibrio sp. Nv6 TaxID=1855340 RepID=UPI0008D5B160|nr:hypothetical protein [Nitrosovibrio sp. Nv6]SEP36681.1 hypothetical protein SAMN05216316_2638 [Nitrosovibrio sp. Nv6]